MTLSALLLAASFAGAPLPPPALVKPCTDPKALASAEQNLNALGAELEQVTSERLEHANASLRTLMSSKCFELAPLENEHVDLPATDAEALRLWWKAGGERWLRSYLTLAKSRRVVIPPDLPRRIAFTEKDGPGLRGLLCDEAGCGEETAEWLRFADEGLLIHERREFETALRRNSKEPRCGQRNWKRGDYLGWRNCVEAERPTRPIYPLAQFKAPQSGWFVISGRRGHYDFCDEVHAYDLVTGAAHVARNCSGLRLAKGGRVDTTATDDGRALTVSRGKVDATKLRELVLIALLADHVARRQPTASDVLVPAAIQIELPKGRTGPFVGSVNEWLSSAQTVLRVVWVQPGGMRDLGTLVWPASCWAGNDNASQLLTALETTFVESPPPAEIQPDLLHAALSSGPPGVSHLDADSAGLWTVHQHLAEALLHKENPSPAPPP